MKCDIVIYKIYVSIILYQLNMISYYVLNIFYGIL